MNHLKSGTEAYVTFSPRLGFCRLWRLVGSRALFFRYVRHELPPPSRGLSLLWDECAPVSVRGRQRTVSKLGCLPDRRCRPSHVWRHLEPVQNGQPGTYDTRPCILRERPFPTLCLCAIFEISSPDVINFPGDDLSPFLLSATSSYACENRWHVHKGKYLESSRLSSSLPF